LQKRLIFLGSLLVTATSYHGPLPTLNHWQKSVAVTRMVKVCHNDFNFLALTCDRDAIHCAALHKIDPSYVIVSVISVMPFPLTLSELESKECIRVLRNIRVIVKLPDRRPSHNFLKVIRVHREANKKSSRKKTHT